MFQANRQEHPLRQPRNAPSGVLTQKDKGFENFLKTHSSPNHHRVTAGGRIVPMEMRPAPPRFSLSASKEASKETPTSDSDQKQTMSQVPPSVAIGKNHFGDRNSSMNSPTKIGASGYQTASSSVLVPSTLSPGLLSHESIPLNLQQAALESNIVMQNQLLAYGQGLSSGSLYPTVSGMASQVSILAQQYPMNLSCLPYATPPTPSDLGNSSLPLAWNADPYLVSTLQTMLTPANQFFDLYDQQLKDLDKYRATHNREVELVRQRVSIVARRAEVKEEVRRLEAAISVRENTYAMAPTISQPRQWSPADTQNPSIQQRRTHGRSLTIKGPNQANEMTPKAKPALSKLNVAAAAYVPMSKVSPITPGTSPGMVQVASAGLRMSALPLTNYSRIDNGSPELKATDAWGERLGAPPVHLLREQKSMASSILSQVNSPKVSDDDASDSASAQSFTFTAESTNKTAFANPGSGSNRTGRAPAPVEDDYERQMDAMRKPDGTVTQILLSDGQTQIVHGLNLKQPHPDKMGDFERAYWTRKPSHHDRATFGNKENSRAPSFAAKTSTLSFNSVHSQDQAKPYRGSLQE
jgi:hypothetical protein